MNIKYDANKLKNLGEKIGALSKNNHLLEKEKSVNNSGYGNDFTKIGFLNLEAMGFMLSSHGVTLESKLKKQEEFLTQAAQKVNHSSAEAEKLIRDAWRENPLDISKNEKCAWMESTPAKMLSLYATWKDALEGAKDAWGVSYGMNLGMKYSTVAELLTSGATKGSKLLGKAFAAVGVISNAAEWKEALEKQKNIDEDYNYSHDSVDRAGDMTTNYIMPVIGTIGVVAGFVAIVAAAPAIVVTATIVAGACAFLGFADQMTGGVLKKEAGNIVRATGDFFNDSGKNVSKGVENVAKGVGDFFKGIKFGW